MLLIFYVHVYTYIPQDSITDWYNKDAAYGEGVIQCNMYSSINLIWIFYFQNTLHQFHEELPL